MPELRQNIATKEWVIISPERGERPEDFARKHKTQKKRLAHNDSCPFCPGHEEQTPAEHMALYDEQGHWKVRVVANKYPALSPDGEVRYSEQGTLRKLSGVGLHDVIVETARHDLDLHAQSPEHIEKILQVYKRSYIEAIADPRIELVTLFKNHGPSAGMSLEHSHSQMIATPVVPSNVRLRVQEAMRYYDDHHHCVYCTMLQDEQASGERILVESEHFVAFVLYAASSPFHTWVVPRRHQSSFPEVRDDELRDLAQVLSTLLRKLHKGLDNPDYNFVIRSHPGTPTTHPFFHWYLSLIPRISTAAGFELGSGMHINTVQPESAAEFLRSVQLDDN